MSKEGLIFWIGHMAGKYVIYDKLETLEQLGKNLWMNKKRVEKKCLKSNYVSIGGWFAKY